MHFITLTFRMLVNIHFQKYNSYKFLESYDTVTMGVWNLDKKHPQFQPRSQGLLFT